MGDKTPEFLTFWRCRADSRTRRAESALDTLLAAIEEQSIPGALLVRPGVLL